MARYLPINLIQKIDRSAVEDFKMNSLVLMENAGRSCCDSIETFLRHGHEELTERSDHFVPEREAIGNRSHVLGGIAPEPRATVLCGAGNNGGDGLVIARHLELRGWRIQIWMLGGIENLAPDCRANYSIAESAGLPIRIWDDSSELQLAADLRESNLIIDAMLGTGARGCPREPFARAILFSNQANSTRVAVDVPTGLDAESGFVGEPTFRADLTCTFVALKPGFRVPEAQEYLGQVDVCSIGVPLKLLQDIFHEAGVPY